MAADARVIPVGDENRSVGGDADIARPEPAISRAVGDVFACGGIARPITLHVVGADDIRAGVAVEERAAEAIGEERPLVDADPGRRSRAGLKEVGDDTGIVQVPMALRYFGLEIRPRHLPACSGALVDVAVVAPLHDEVDPHPLIAVVVVVALPERAVGIDRDFVVVAEVVAENLEVAAVGIAAEHHPLPVGLAAVVDDIPHPVDDRLALRIVDGVTGVAEVEIPAAVGADGEGMDGMVVLRVAGLCEQRLLPVGDEIAIVIVEHEHVRRTRHDHLPPRSVADDADPQRRIDVAPLVKDLRRVGNAVAVGVFEDEDPVAVGPRVLAATVVGDLAHPHPPRGVDVDIGGAREERFGGEQRRFKLLRDHERGSAVSGSDSAAGLRALGAKRRGLGVDGKADRAGALVGAAVVEPGPSHQPCGTRRHRHLDHRIGMRADPATDKLAVELQLAPSGVPPFLHLAPLGGGALPFEIDKRLLEAGSLEDRIDPVGPIAPEPVAAVIDDEPHRRGTAELDIKGDGARRRGSGDDLAAPKWLRAGRLIGGGGGREGGPRDDRRDAGSGAPPAAERRPNRVPNFRNEPPHDRNSSGILNRSTGKRPHQPIVPLPVATAAV